MSQQPLALSRRKMRKPIRIEHITPYFYILPSLVLFFLFVFYPFAKTVCLSTALTNTSGEAIRFIGLNNYKDVLTSNEFWFSLSVTLRYALMVVVGSLFMGGLSAILAQEAFFGRGFVRTVLAMPMAISSACIAVISVFILHPQAGILNHLMGTNIKFLRSITYALPSVAAVTIWMNTGVNFIFFLAALQGVDRSLYEAGDIEGTNFFQRLWHITLPSISPTIFFLTVINIIGSFQAYAQIRLMTQGGPGRFTQVVVYSIYLEAFQNNRYGTAATMSVLLFLILLLLTAIQFRMEKRVTY